MRTGSWMGPPQGERAPRVGPICIVILAREPRHGPHRVRAQENKGVAHNNDVSPGDRSLTHLTFENCCPATRIDFWNPHEDSGMVPDLSPGNALVIHHIHRVMSPRTTRSRRTGGVPREQKMLKGHLLRVIDHQAYQYTKKTRQWPLPSATMFYWCQKTLLRRKKPRS